MSSDIEKWMRKVEQTLVELDRRIRSKPVGDPSAGSTPIGPAGGDLTGTYPNPSLSAGSVTGGPGGKIADGTITDADVAPANKDGAAATPSLRTLGTGAQQAAAGNDARLSDARTPKAHTHNASDITVGTLSIARLPVGTTASTVAAGNHRHTLSAIDEGGTMNAPLVMVDRTTTPGSVPAGSTALYFKTDGYAYTVDETGVEKPLIPRPDQLHVNPTLDNTIMTDRGGGDGIVPMHEAPAGWSWYWTAQGLYWESDEVNTLYGLGKSAKIALQAGEGALLSSSVFAVTPGALVTVSGWTRSTGPRSFLTILTSPASATPDFFAGPTVATSDSPVVVAGSTWQKITHSFVVPDGHTKARFMLRVDTGPGQMVGTCWWDETESSMRTQPQAQVIPGTIIMWPSSTAPAGYLACNGGTFSSETHPALAAVLGDLFGTHSGTTYYLPDFRARSPIGVGGAAVGGGSIGNSYSVGQKYGHESMQAHSHSGQTGDDYPDHSHSSHVVTWGAAFGTAGQGGYSFPSGGSPNGAGTAGANTRHRHSIPTDGGGNAQNVHPVLGINFVIKT